MSDRPPAPVEYFPGSTEIVPPFLTAHEVARLLRLDEDNDGERSVGAALQSVEHLVRRRLLRPLPIGRRRLFAREDVLDLPRLTAREGRVPERHSGGIRPENGPDDPDKAADSAMAVDMAVTRRPKHRGSAA